MGAYLKEANFGEELLPHTTFEFPHGCSERYLLKENDGEQKVHGVMLHAGKTCTGLDEDIARIETETLVAYSEERKAFSEIRGTNPARPC